MALYYITGSSASGKSSVLSELKKRGYQSYDVDEAGPATAKWHNINTGYIHPKSSVKKEDRTPEFLAEHSWQVPRDEVVELAHQAQNKIIFLGGAIENEADLRDLFYLVFALSIDNATLRSRIAKRTNNDWGKAQHELDHTIKANGELNEKYAKYGDKVVDATQPLNNVVEDILRQI